MKFFITKEQNQFFSENGWIEFEQVIPQKRLNEVNKEISEVLARRSKGDKRDLLSASFAYKNGRDSWRASNEIKKFCTQKIFIEVADSFLHLKRTLLAFDQLILSENPNSIQEKPFYRTNFEEPLSLRELFCAQDICSGILVCLKGNKEEDDSLFPRLAGNMVLLSPTTPIDMLQLESTDKFLHLLILYSEMQSIYCYQKNDPNTHCLKQLGFSFGDRLSIAGCPLIHS